MTATAFWASDYHTESNFLSSVDQKEKNLYGVAEANRCKPSNGWLGSREQIVGYPALHTLPIWLIHKRMVDLR